MTKDQVNDKENEKKVEFPNFAKFIISGIAGCGSTLVCHPIDVVKNRMQLSGEGGAAKAHKSSLHAVMNIAKNEGYASFYNGLSANLARQLTYTTIRLGSYQVAIDKINKWGQEGFKAQLNASLISGLLASSVGVPADVALIRMTADNRLPPAERRNYKHVFDALARIYKEEGLQGLWVGSTPTILRAMAANVTQIVSYVQAKHFLIDNNYMSDSPLCHLVSSLTAGLIYAFFTVPLDVAKTRLQTMKIINGKPEYSGMADVYVKILKNEGVYAFWKGFGPYYFKIAPNTVLLFMISEKLTYAYKKYVLKDTSVKGGF